MRTTNRFHTRACNAVSRLRVWASAPVLMALLFAASLSTVTAGAQTTHKGQWSIEPYPDPRFISLVLRHQTKSYGHSATSFVIPPERVQGLLKAKASGNSSPLRFQLNGEAGIFDLEGAYDQGKAGGTWTFVASQTFLAQMREKGYSNVSADEQLYFALSSFTPAIIDELRAQGYELPPIEGLVRMSSHNVSLNYLRELKGLGYKLESVDELVRMHDHRVSPEFIRQFRSLGYNEIPADELLRARDHGVTVDFVQQLRELGYEGLSPVELTRLRDRGVTPGFIRQFKSLGYDSLSTEQLIRLRDSRIDPAFVSEATARGYKDLSVERLITLKISGFNKK